MKRQPNANKEQLPLWKITAIIVAVIAGGIYLLLPEQEKVQTFAELHGLWRSEDPRYRDCYLAFEESLIAVGAADGNEYVYFLESFEKTEEDMKTSYTFNTENIKGEEFTLWFHRKKEEKNPALHFKSQPHIIWTKSLEESEF